MSATQPAVPGSLASDSPAGHLQLLIDLIELHLQGKQAHWNVVGPNFRGLHQQLDELVDAVREFSDQVAERMRALGVTADGRSATVVAGTGLPALPAGELNTATVVALLTDRLRTAAGTLREVHDDVDREDPTTADIVHQIIEQLEKHAWMLSAETRAPLS